MVGLSRSRTGRCDASVLAVADKKSLAFSFRVWYRGDVGIKVVWEVGMTRAKGYSVAEIMDAASVEVDAYMDGFVEATGEDHPLDALAALGSSEEDLYDIACTARELAERMNDALATGDRSAVVMTAVLYWAVMEKAHEVNAHERMTVANALSRAADGPHH